MAHKLCLKRLVPGVAVVATPWAALGASVATYMAALDSQLTPDGAAPVAVLEPWARGVLGGLAGLRCGSLHLEGCGPSPFDPRALL